MTRLVPSPTADDDPGQVGPASILVVDQDREIGEPLVEQLAADGYRPSLAHTAEHARILAAGTPPALVILGRLDPPRGPLDLLAEIRGAESHSDRDGNPWREDLPVIVVGCSARYLDLLRAFETGADDFLARPARYLELRARIRARLRRALYEQGERPLRVGPLVVDSHRRTASLQGQPLQLRPLEYQLLLHLSRDPARVFAKRDLLRAVCGYETPGSTRTLDSHASRLRRRLVAHDGGDWVVNVRGVGYRLR